LDLVGRTGGAVARFFGSLKAAFFAAHWKADAGDNALSREGVTNLASDRIRLDVGGRARTQRKQ